MIIGITGTNGAGKGTVVDYLVNTKGFAHYSVRAFLLEEIERRGLPADRDSMRTVANELRKEHAPSYIIELLFARAKEQGQDALIESVRAIGEAEFLKKEGALLLAVDADRKTRYERIVLRGSETDKVDFDTWVAQEDRELSSTDQWDMNVTGVMKMADATVENNGSVEELYAATDEALTRFS